MNIRLLTLISVSILAGLSIGGVGGATWANSCWPSGITVGKDGNNDEEKGKEQGNKDEEDEDKDKEGGGEVISEEGKLGKCKWKKIEQIWDDSKVIWADRPANPSSSSSKDTSRYLFIAKHRVYPSSGDEEGFTVVEINSEPLTEVLKFHLKESDSVYDEKPSATVTEIFTFRESIREWIKEKKVQIEEMKKEQGWTVEDDESSDEEEKNEGKEEENKKDNSKDPKEKQKKQKTKLTEKEKEEKAKAKKERKEKREKRRKEREEKVKEKEKQKVEEEKKQRGEEVEELETDGVVDDPPAAEDDLLASLNDQSLLGSKSHQIPLSKLITMVHHTESLMTFITHQFTSLESKLSRLKPRGEIPFKLLWTIMVPGLLMVTTHNQTGEKMGFVLKRASDNGRVFLVTGTCVEWNGEKYVNTNIERGIVPYRGLRKINSLIVYPMTPKIKQDLIQRSHLYEKYSGNHFLNYQGILYKESNNGTIKLRADGRIMIDTKSYRKMCPNGDYWSGIFDDDDFLPSTTVIVTDENKVKPKLLDHQRALTPSTTYGFSFTLKEWGEMRIDGFSSIDFDPKIYDHLVMDPDQKKMIRALVQSPRTGLLTDVVQGKGGGTIILAHGPPGTGKTLTAEGIAELLERPLYIVSSGELGTHASQLENNLRDTLEIAQTWDAVLLIDEADVFLEARSDHEMGRNSLVSVFLRVLEYFNGVLILTTNRVQVFDEAFLSRFSCAIKYPSLDRAKREVIWTKFLALAGAEVEGADKKSIPGSKKMISNGIPNGVDSDGNTSSGSSSPVTTRPFISLKELQDFASRPLNGRQVKNITRTAQALALSDNAPFAAKYVRTVIKLNEAFSEDFKSVDKEGMYAVKGESWQEKNPLYR